LLKMGVDGEESEAAIMSLVRWMDREGSTNSPERLLDKYPQAKDALQSLHVISVSDGRVTFGHQSYFEYLLATDLLDSITAAATTIPAWIKQREQSLFRREQLRQLLSMLRDDCPARYLAAVSDLLADVDIRFHLKHLALRFLGDCSEPRSGEV